MVQRSLPMTSLTQSEDGLTVEYSFADMSNNVYGIGVDCCSVRRWKNMIQRRQNIIKWLLAPGERPLRAESQAARWAAKEALIKATGISLIGRFTECEIVTLPTGRPTFHFSLSLQKDLNRVDINHIEVSLSHDDDMAVAFVVCDVAHNKH